jgi:hypothetical protein
MGFPANCTDASDVDADADVVEDVGVDADVDAADDADASAAEEVSVVVVCGCVESQPASDNIASGRSSRAQSSAVIFFETVVMSIPF